VAVAVCSVGFVRCGKPKEEVEVAPVAASARQTGYRNKKAVAENSSGLFSLF
jgi:hypothetical protein